MACCGKQRARFLNKVQQKAELDKLNNGNTSSTAKKALTSIEQRIRQRSGKIAQRKARIEARAARIKRRNERARTNS